VSHVPDEAREDFEKAFLRARRTLRHLFHIFRGDKSFNPNECDGCKEIHQFLTDPGYRGDENFPVGESIDPDWKLARRNGSAFCKSFALDSANGCRALP